MGLTKVALAQKLSPARVNAAISALPPAARFFFEADARAQVESGAFSAAAVQRAVHPTDDLKEYAARMDAFAARASEKGCRLIAYPEYNCLDLLGFMPGAGKAKSARLSARLLEEIAEPVSRGMRMVFARIAQRHGLYLYAGTWPERSADGKGICNIGVLFSPEGEPILIQPKLHLMPQERELGFLPGEKLEAAEISGVRVCCPVCLDAAFFEPFMLADREGCRLAIVPIADMSAEYSWYAALRGAWARAQESFLYVVRPALTGTLADAVFTGRSAVFAPLTATEEETGICAISPEPEGDYLCTAHLDFARLADARAKAETFGDTNERFERDYRARYLARYR